MPSHTAEVVALMSFHVLVIAFFTLSMYVGTSPANSVTATIMFAIHSITPVMPSIQNAKNAPSGSLFSIKKPMAPLSRSTAAARPSPSAAPSSSITAGSISPMAVLSVSNADVAPSMRAPPNGSSASMTLFFINSHFSGQSAVAS